ncbi:sigma 54-interacting transcriptional regulator [Bacillota bacterium]
MELMMIRDTVMSVAQAITAALEIDTEIVDHRLEIIAGTGRYIKKIGNHEEGGDLNTGAIYGKILKTGAEYICTDCSTDPYYGPEEGELAEISCPILLDGKVVGIIGLVAFTDDQKNKIVNKLENLRLFLKRMAELIASKLSEAEKRNQLNAILESMHEGLIAVDKDGFIVSCNSKSEQLLNISRSEMDGNQLSVIWDIPEVKRSIDKSLLIKDKDIVYKKARSRSKRFLCTIIPLSVDEAVGAGAEKLGAILLFQDISDAKARLYKMTADEKRTTFDDIIGSSETLHFIKQRAAQVAASDSTVLITGESGTGKELFARAIHYAGSRRNDPFVAINCGAIPEMLLESELFGYERGAFTGADVGGKLGKFEFAHKGTLFLDEIGDMPLHLQVKLLQTLQNRQIERVGGLNPIDIDVRIIAATNRNLEHMITAKEFRGDLYFRLNVIPLHIPPLKERKEDIEHLLRYALNKFNMLLHKNIKDFQSDALNALLKYEWPGNVRELENVVEYAVNMETGDEISFQNLPERIVRKYSGGNNSHLSFKDKMDNYQGKLIKECLEITGMSTEGKIRCAKILGMSESTLYRRIKELGI